MFLDKRTMRLAAIITDEGTRRSSALDQERRSEALGKAGPRVVVDHISTGPQFLIATLPHAFTTSFVHIKPDTG